MSNTDILNLPAVTALSGTEYAPVVQGGTTKRAKVSQFDLTGQLPGSAQDANTVFAGPTSGSPDFPAFRDLVAADIPNGLPAGGDTGQQLVKLSDDDYDVGWVDDPAVPEPANTVLAGPTTGPDADPTFRALVVADLPIVTAAKGGTGQSSYTIGDILYASGATALSKLADVATGNALISGGVATAPAWGKIGLTTHVSGILPVANGGSGVASTTAYAVLCGGTTSTSPFQGVASVGTTGQALLSNGAGQLPTFQTLSSAVGAALTRVDDTNVTLTLGGTPTTALLAATSITAGWSGQLSIARGGTGQSTATAAFDALAPTTTRGDLIFRNATVNTRLAASTSGYLLQTNGAGTDPTWSGFLQDGTGATTLTWQTKLRQYVNVDDFGAVGDGSTDDRVAIQAAIDATASGGILLFGPKTYAVSKASGAYALTRSTPITFKGSQGTVIKPLSTLSTTNDIFYMNGHADGQTIPTIFDGIFIGDRSTATRYGRHAVVLDTQAATTYFGGFKTRDCFFQQATTTGGYGIFAINLVGSNANGGLYAATIENSSIAGISLNASGDSIWIKTSRLTGAQEGVYATLVVNAGNLVIDTCNITAAAGSVVLDRSVSTQIINCEMEQQATNTESNNSMIDLRGSTATLGPVRIEGCMLQDVAATGNPTIIRVGDCTGAVITANRIATSTARTAVDITSSAVNPSWNVATNTLVTGTLSDSSTTTKYILPANTSGAWLSYSPTVAATAGTFTSVAATGAWMKIGNTVHVRFTVTVTTNGTAATSFTVTLPAAPFANVEMFVGGRRVNDGQLFGGRIRSGLGTLATCTLFDGSYGLVDGSVVNFTGSYEAA